MYLSFHTHIIQSIRHGECFIFRLSSFVDLFALTFAFRLAVPVPHFLFGVKYIQICRYASRTSIELLRASGMATHGPWATWKTRLMIFFSLSNPHYNHRLYSKYFYTNCYASSHPLSHLCMHRLSSNGGTYGILRLLIGGSIEDVNGRLAWAS